MRTYGLSVLEIKHLIERALLPDKCECRIVNGYLAIEIYSLTNPSDTVQINGISMDSLTSSRALAELVGEARYRLAQASKGFAGRSEHENQGLSKRQRQR